MNRDKFWCQPCDLVFKGNHPLTCPGCNEPMRWMGDKWRVGAKGHRVDWIPARRRISVLVVSERHQSDAGTQAARRDHLGQEAGTLGADQEVR